jgi:hypothetical protein
MNFPHTGGVHVFLTCAIPVAVNFVSMWPEPDRLIYDQFTGSGQSGWR